jgi:hypothetical protein
LARREVRCREAARAGRGLAGESGQVGAAGSVAAGEAAGGARERGAQRVPPAARRRTRRLQLAHEGDRGEARLKRASQPRSLGDAEKGVRCAAAGLIGRRSV